MPGIESADYEVAETCGSVDELGKLFAGAKVVCNMVGSFIYNGPKVVEASLKAGCHYGIKHIELEFWTDWFLDGKRKKQSDIRRQKLLKAAEMLQARHLKVAILIANTIRWTNSRTLSLNYALMEQRTERESVLN